MSEAIGLSWELPPPNKFNLLQLRYDSPLIYQKLKLMDEALVCEIMNEFNKRMDVMLPTKDREEWSWVQSVKKYVLKDILNREHFVKYIECPEDLREVTNRIVDLLTGTLPSPEIPDAREKIVSARLRAIEALPRDDLAHDFDVIQRVQKRSPAEVSSLTAVSDLVRTSKDLERFELFFSRLAKQGVDVPKMVKPLIERRMLTEIPLFGYRNSDEYFYEGKEKVTVECRYGEWQRTISDEKKLDTILTFVERAVAKNPGVAVFLNGIGKRLIAEVEVDTDELEQLVEAHERICDQIDTLFNGGSYPEALKKEVFSAVGTVFGESIRTSEDLLLYGHLATEGIRYHLSEQKKEDGAYGASASGYMTDFLGRIKMILRDDPRADLQTVEGILKERPLAFGSFDISVGLSNMRGLIRTSSDLDRVASFIHDLSIHKVDASLLLGGSGVHRGYRVHQPLFGARKETSSDTRTSVREYEQLDIKRAEAWEEVVETSNELNDALTVIADLFISTSIPEVGTQISLSHDERRQRDLVSILNDIPVGERKAFLSLAAQFRSRTDDIRSEFILQNRDTVTDGDFEKQGLEVFKTQKAKISWLTYCVDSWKKRPQSMASTMYYFNEARLLASVDPDYPFPAPLPSEPMSEERVGICEIATKLLNAFITDRIQHLDVKSLELVKLWMADGSELMRKFDTEYAEKTRGFLSTYFEGNRVDYDKRQRSDYPLFADPSARQLLPRTFAAAVKEEYWDILHSPLSDQARDGVALFRQLTGISPDVSSIQPRYDALLKEYIETYSQFFDDGGMVEDRGERSAASLAALSEVAGVKPVFSPDMVHGFYRFCVVDPPAQGSSQHHPRSVFHHKIGVIYQITGIHPGEEFIKEHILQNREFASAITLPISAAQLDEYFANPEHTTAGEYRRIYTIFGCFEYYQGILAELEKDPSRLAKQKMIGILAAMGLRDMEDAERYANIKERLMGFVEEKGAPLTESLGEVLAELAKAGDENLLTYFASTLRERAKASKEREEGRGVLGLTSLQEVALRALNHVDSPTSNEQLFSLVFVTDFDSRVRAYILQQLITKKPNFFSPNVRMWIASELKTKKSKMNWKDVGYVYESHKIPSADLKKKTLQILDRSYVDISEWGISPSDIHEKQCPNIPKNAFLPVWFLTRSVPGMLEKWDTMYKMTKASSDREALLFGVVNILSLRPRTLKNFTDRLGGMDVAAPGSVKPLAELLKTMSFLGVIEREFGESGENAFTVLDGKADSLADLSRALKEVVVQKIKQVLPHGGIDVDMIERLWEQWGSLEPIFVYAGKMREGYYDGTLHLLAEMVAHMDAPVYDVWKSWRYNTGMRSVHGQIGHLEAGSLELWKQDHLAELGDIAMTVSPANKPKQIVQSLQNALGEGHIYHPEMHASDRHKFIQEELRRVYVSIAERPEQKELFLRDAADSLWADLKKIDAIIRYSSLPKLEQAMALFAEGKQVSINAKTKNALSFLEQFISKEQFQGIQGTYKEVEEKKATSVDGGAIIDPALKVFLCGKAEEIKRDYEATLSSDVLDKYGLNRDQLKNMGPFYQKRQELKALLDLYRISALDAGRIATNRISDRPDKKGETLLSVIESLKVYFKDNPTFVQDIENIQSTISQRGELGSKRRLAMIVTDNPQMLIQAGKYPIGCGSCQNYEGDPGWNRSLAGYMSDAHIKVAYLIDVNKLPSDIVLDIESRGFEAVRNRIPPHALLDASVARSIVKLTMIGDAPTLFIEPTYSSINKGDLSMNKYFDIFLELEVSNPMGIKLARGGGDEIAQVPKSRNPNGQYEDCAAGNAGHAGMGIQEYAYTMPARFINKFSPVNDEDRRLAERISR